jgi:DNA-directed RNA polymerase subunit RPC12/RpoP
MTQRVYCLECGERWSLDADRHQMRCPARALLLLRRTADAQAYRGVMDDAPRPKAGARESTRPSRAYRCKGCDGPWSIYPQNHQRGCPAARLLSRGQREDAKKRWRIRPGELARPEAPVGLAARFRFASGGAR